MGRGAFGKVYLGELEDSDEKFAIKNIRKDRLVERRESIKSVLIEFQILFQANHPFLCSMYYFFLSEERFYFVMPFIGCGEMSKVHKSFDSKFSED